MVSFEVFAVEIAISSSRKESLPHHPHTSDVLMGTWASFAPCPGDRGVAPDGITYLFNK
jgi:hypothetical protein